jgi:prepilin-type N-terminal cleavage/methylation domain-containing protein
MKARGFTLVEVIIAIFVVAVALVAILQVFSMDIRSVQNAREHLRATVHAQELMEELAADPYSRTSSGNEVLVYSTIDYDQVTVNVNWKNLDSRGTVALVREFFK